MLNYVVGAKVVNIFNIGVVWCNKTMLQMAKCRINPSNLIIWKNIVKLAEFI